MPFSSRSLDRPSSTSGERRCAHGSCRQGLAFRPAFSALENRRVSRTPRHLFRERGTRSTVLNAAVNILWTIGTASAMIAPVLGLVWAGPPGEAPDPQGPPSSGIVLRTEVTAIWMPRALRATRKTE
jgi:hypothetical protein